nr:putative reverse transcriptase domain-containing protein [Tanacetum cinerariifolium]
MQAARDRQQSYADLKHKLMEFQVGDKVMLKVSPWKGVVRFGKRGKLNPTYVGPFNVLERVGDVFYKIDLPEELSREPVEIMDHEVKRLKRSRIPLVKHQPMKFQIGDRVMLKVSPWKGVVRFEKRGKLNPRYVGPFKVLDKVGTVSYKLELPQELNRVQNTFHVSNLKKCHDDEPLVIPLDGLHFDDKLHFVEEPVEIVDQEVKRLKRSRIPLINV